MPSQTCRDLEVINNVVSGNKYFYVGSEIGKNAIKAISDKMYDKDNFILMPMSIGEVVAVAHENEYSHIDFDFCETFVSNYQIIQDAVQRNAVKVGGIIAMTFDSRDAKMKLLAPSIIGRKKCKALGWKGLVLPTITKFLKSVGGRRYEIIHTPETYSDSPVGIGANMVFAMIRRVK